jgi:hypothetical protein
MTEDVLEGLDRRLDRTSLMLTLASMPILFALRSASVAFSFGAGALLAYVNFHWLKQAVDFVILKGAQGGVGGRVMFRFVARYALIALFLYVTIQSSILSLSFVFAGLLVYVVAILVECVSQVCRVLIRDYRNGRTTSNS